MWRIMPRPVPDRAAPVRPAAHPRGAPSDWRACIERVEAFAAAQATVLVVRILQALAGVGAPPNPIRVVTRPR